MDTIIAKFNILLQNLTKTAEGVMVLPLKKWKSIEGDLEDLEMYRSNSFVKEISDRRKETRVIPLAKLLKKYKIST